VGGGQRVERRRAVGGAGLGVDPRPPGLGGDPGLGQALGGLGDRAAQLGRERVKGRPDRADQPGGDAEVAAQLGRVAVEPGASRRELRVEGVSVPGRLESVSFTVGEGEVVGLAGLQGSGHTAVLELLWGRAKPSAGEVSLPGGAARPASLAEAVRRGVAYVPDDRKRLGLMLEASLAQNITSVSWLAERKGGTLLRPHRMAGIARRAIADLRIRGGPSDPATYLSGGNQQKAVFAKWLEAKPSLVLLDDPTRGVDVGAKAEMHAIIRRLAGEGRVVLICSTDLAELATVCDRVLVMQRGRITGELSGEGLSEYELLRAINEGLVPREGGD
jgi:ribose transport system ATP-binding protein